MVIHINFVFTVDAVMQLPLNPTNVNNAKRTVTSCVYIYIYVCVSLCVCSRILIILEMHKIRLVIV